MHHGAKVLQYLTEFDNDLEAQERTGTVVEATDTSWLETQNTATIVYGPNIDEFMMIPIGDFLYGLSIVGSSRAPSILSDGPRSSSVSVLGRNRALTPVNMDKKYDGPSSSGITTSTSNARNIAGTTLNSTSSAKCLPGHVLLPPPQARLHRSIRRAASLSSHLVGS